MDVIATDTRGRRIDALTPKDFEVSQDGVIQSIDSARFVKAQPAGDIPSIAIDSDAVERAEASRPNTRLVGIFLDEYHVESGNTARVREAVSRFVSESLGPQDLIAIMRPLDSLFSIRVTRDREELRKIIDSFEGRQGEYEPRGPYERNYMAGTPARIEQLRAQVAVSALDALASHLGRLDGDSRKTLVVVSEGLPRPDRHRGLEMLSTFDTVTRAANRYNVAVYAVDPRPAAAGDQASDRDALRVLAVSTSGQPIAGADDLGTAMRPIASDASGYYILRYTTTDKQDGRFHDVQVTVKKPGIIVRSRKGYWAATPDEELRAALLRPRPQRPLEPARHLSPFIKPWFGLSRGSEGKTRVTFVWEPAAPIFGQKRPTAAHVALTALAADDTPLFDGRVAPTGPLRPDPNDGASRAVFEVRPGTVRLRMTIENEAEQQIDNDVRDLTVRDLSAPLVLGTPEVFRGRTALDFKSLISSPDVTPVASREFSRTERLVIRVPAYAPGDAPATVAARLMNRKGQVIRDLPSREGTTAATAAEIDLPLAAFAVGDYRIEIAAASPTAKVIDVLEFRVTD